MTIQDLLTVCVMLNNSSYLAPQYVSFLKPGRKNTEGISIDQVVD